MFANYHLNVGVDRVFIFLDDPNDEAAAHLEQIDGVTCIRCNEEYWARNGGKRPEVLDERLVANINNGLAMAREQGFEWAIFIDNDELVFPEGRLKETLNQCGADVVRFTILEAVSEQERYEHIFAPSLFKKPARSIQVRLAMLLGCRRAFFEGRYFRGHQDSKVAVRTAADIKKMGVHRPIDAGAGVVEKTTRRIKLLHFDCVGMDSWKSKWLCRIDVSANTNVLGKNRKRQMEVFAEALGGNEEKLRELYGEIYVIPNYEQIVLRLLNMMTTIKVDGRLFENQV